jgi:hypothetical protein
LQSRRWRTFTLCAFASLSAADIAYEPAHRSIFGKASYSSEATFRIPGSRLELVLDRRCIHLFLGEYERTLILRDEDSELLRHEVAVDTGGQGRMDVYQISSSIFYLQGTLSFDRYLLDIAAPSLTDHEAGNIPRDAKFLGAFDRDEKGWRFISAAERNEVTSEGSGDEQRSASVE